MELEVTVDSGACGTVMPADCAEHIRVHSHSQGHQGYEAANGSTIHNVGERRCWVSHDGAKVADQLLMHFQVADIRKPLLSITKTVDMGFECILGKSGGYLLDTHLGGRIPIQRKGNLYVMKLWIKKAPVRVLHGRNNH